MPKFLNSILKTNKNKEDSTHNGQEPLRVDVARYDATYSVTMDVLRLVGLRLTLNDRPLVKILWNLFYWFELANLFIVTWLELFKMVETGGGGSFQDAVEIFRMMPCVGYLLLAMCKSYKLVHQRPVYENLVSELRDMWPKGDVTREEYDVIDTALRQLRYVVTGYYWCNNFLMVVFLSPPFVELLKKAFNHDVPLILPFFYWFPFDPFQRVYYEIILVFQTWHGLITIWFMLSGDLLFCIFLSHITTQFDLLAIRIRKLIYVPLDAQLLADFPLGIQAVRKSKYSQEQETSVRGSDEQWEDSWEASHLHQLNAVIQRHRALIRLSGDVENLFSFALLVNFFNSSIILCFCGFCCIIVEKWNEMIYKSFLTTALSQTWLLCWYGQRLQESSLGVGDALYECGWYQGSRKLRNSVIIMIQRAQKEVHVTTYGFTVVCLASYTTIIKTSWSYFTLLLNVYKKP